MAGIYRKRHFGPLRLCIGHSLAVAMTYVVKNLIHRVLNPCFTETEVTTLKVPKPASIIDFKIKYVPSQTTEIKHSSVLPNQNHAVALLHTIWKLL